VLFIKIFGKIGHPFLGDEAAEKVGNKRAAIGSMSFPGDNGDVTLGVHVPDSSDGANRGH